MQDRKQDGVGEQRAIHADEPPLSRYSPAVEVTLAGARLLLVSGQVALDSDGNVAARGDVGGQARTCYEGIEALVSQAGGSLADVARTTVFLRNMADLGELKDVRDSFDWGEVPPATTAVSVGEFPHPHVLVEIDAIAVLID